MTRGSDARASRQGIGYGVAYWSECETARCETARSVALLSLLRVMPATRAKKTASTVTVPPIQAVDFNFNF